MRNKGCDLLVTSTKVPPIQFSSNPPGAALRTSSLVVKGGFEPTTPGGSNLPAPYVFLAVCSKTI